MCSATDLLRMDLPPPVDVPPADLPPPVDVPLPPKPNDLPPIDLPRLWLSGGTRRPVLLAGTECPLAVAGRDGCKAGDKD